MNANFRNRQLPGNSPLANVLVVIVGAIAIAVSFVIGVFAFVALAAAVLILGAIIGIRVWWLGVRPQNRQNRPRASESSDRQSPSDAVIEGEFHEIAGDKPENGPPQS